MLHVAVLQPVADGTADWTALPGVALLLRGAGHAGQGCR